MESGVPRAASLGAIQDAGRRGKAERRQHRGGDDVRGPQKLGVVRRRLPQVPLDVQADRLLRAGRRPGALLPLPPVHGPGAPAPHAPAAPRPDEVPQLRPALGVGRARARHGRLRERGRGEPADARQPGPAGPYEHPCAGDLRAGGLGHRPARGSPALAPGDDRGRGGRGHDGSPGLCRARRGPSGDCHRRGPDPKLLPRACGGGQGRHRDREGCHLLGCPGLRPEEGEAEPFAVHSEEASDQRRWQAGVDSAGDCQLGEGLGSVWGARGPQAEALGHGSRDLQGPGRPARLLGPMVKSDRTPSLPGGGRRLLALLRPRFGRRPPLGWWAGAPALSDRRPPGVQDTGVSRPRSDRHQLEVCGTDSLGAPRQEDGHCACHGCSDCLLLPRRVHPHAVWGGPFAQG
mmetsp:Transcript_78764/g.244382  ORF Transcript_78764/g.244382 Transcript_78764/m.244382 type:complete len:404 (+) Transcript_78764:135-1346(+)